jgi:hypothetical protein
VGDHIKAYREREREERRESVIKRKSSLYTEAVWCIINTGLPILGGVMLCPPPNLLLQY